MSKNLEPKRLRMVQKIAQKRFVQKSAQEKFGWKKFGQKPPALMGTHPTRHGEVGKQEVRPEVVRLEAIRLDMIIKFYRSIGSRRA